MTQGIVEQPQVITIAARKFQMTGAELTAAQENFMQGQLRAAGVMEILKAPDSNIDTHAEQILTALLVTGRDAWVIAAMLVECGKRWRYEDACANAQLFADVTDRESKIILQTILFGCVRGFFTKEGKSLLLSPNYSQQPTGDPQAAQDGVSAAQGTLAPLPC